MYYAHCYIGLDLFLLAINPYIYILILNLIYIF